jgi:hypothetical protein
MTCGHNKSFKERCIECELVLVREGLAWSERKASEYRDAVVRLEAELAPTKPQPNFAKSSLASGALTEPQTLSESTQDLREQNLRGLLREARDYVEVAGTDHSASLLNDIDDTLVVTRPLLCAHGVKIGNTCVGCMGAATLSSHHSAPQGE